MSRSTSRRTSSRPGSRGAPTQLRATDLPSGPQDTTTGVVELVVDPDRNAVTVHVNGVPSSYVDLDDPGLLTFEYMQQMAAVIETAVPGTLRAIHLGAAGCSMARWVEHTRPGSTQTAVDLDDQLLVRAREWFDLPRSPRLRLRPGDAREVLAGLRPGSADVVVRDVFAGDRTPDHLTTLEMAREVWRVLAPGGIYLANCADRPPLRRARDEVATLLAAGADDIVLIAEPAILRGKRYGNLVIAARRPLERAVGDVDPSPDERTALIDDPGLDRGLRTLSVPARAVGGAELAAFARTARVLRDPVP